MSATRSTSQLIVHLVSARAEEAFATRRVFASASNAVWDPPRIHGKISYQCLNLDPLKMYLTFPVEQGSDFALSHIKDCLQLFKPDLSIMTGICAGPRGKVNLGDVIVATRAFNYERGKKSDQGHQVQPILFASDGLDAWMPWIQSTMSGRRSFITDRSPDPRFSISPEGFLKRAVYEYQNGVSQSTWLWAHGFDRSKSLVDNKTLIPNYNYAMNVLVNSREVKLDNLQLQVSDEVYNRIKTSVQYYGTFWGEIENPYPELKLRGKLMFSHQQLCDMGYVFCPKNHLFSSYTHYGVYASGSSVRSDTVIRKYRPWDCPEIEADEKTSLAFEDARAQYRDTLAIDMEGAAFYQALQGTGIHAVCIKGVSDYSDHTKDDQIHEYAKETAAAYAWNLIKYYYKHKFSTVFSTVFPLSMDG
jgi:hypothetical protein